MTTRYSTFSLGGTRIAVVSVPLEDPHELTAAEANVARLIARGMSNAEIATKRGTSARTVANQVRAILKKLAVRTRRDVVTALLPKAR